MIVIIKYSYFAALKIHVSPRTKEVLDGFGIFNLKKRKHTVTLKVSSIYNIYILFQGNRKMLT